MIPMAKWRASMAACFLSSATVAPVAAAAEWGGGSAPGTSYFSLSDRRPLDGSYRPGYAATNWNGLYFGGNAGWGSGESHLSAPINRSVDPSGFLGGLHAGYNFQSGSLVTGLEIDANWTGSEGSEDLSGGDQLRASADWVSSLRLRLGYATGSWLFYGTAGVAMGGLDLSITGPGTDITLSETLTGYAVGLGAELALTPAISLRAEALHYGFGEETMTTSHGSIDTDLDLTTIRGGLSIKLN